MKANLVPRDPSLDSIKTKTLILEKVQVDLSDKNFLQKLEKEVKKEPRKARKLKKALIATQMGLTLTLALITPVYAAAPAPLPQEITNLFTTIMIVVTLVGVGSAIIALMLAGILKFAFRGSQADQWTQNILKGLGQILTSPVLVGLIVSIAVLVFQGIPIFQPLINPLGDFFGR